jgi:hypothetical protein
MPSTLKRGLERTSCDFCFRRKIKCDRQERAGHGLASCSQCDGRGEPCQLDDSDDIRIRRRRIGGAVGTTAALPSRSNNAAIAVADTTNAEMGRSLRSSISQAGAADVLPAPDRGGLGVFGEDNFTLSDDSLLFLDQIFMDGQFSSWWTDSSTTGSVGMFTPESVVQIGGNGIDPNAKPDRTATDLPKVESVTLALHAYFDTAALHLPILLADAFWADYEAGHCRPALIYAVACRGMPFTDVADKWLLQQQLARKFRASFLEARTTELDAGAGIPLEDLEALALMVDFEYDNDHADGTEEAPREANLGKLFLTHEALVMMLLRSQPMGQRSAEGKCRMLLYWHVYGLEAFHCLDRKTQSHIQDLDSIDDAGSVQHEARDYFDAILGLAIIARKITTTLCSPAAKRGGIKMHDVRAMYERLEEWRRNGCPKHLRRERNPAGDLVHDLTETGAQSAGGEKWWHLQLRRAVLWALEINCTMQIEACVDSIGLRQEGWASEQIVLRIEAESLRGVSEMRDIAEWMGKIETEARRVAELGSNVSAGVLRYALTDLAPNILRNACAGTSYWICQRGIDTFARYDKPSGQKYVREEGMGKEQVKRYQETASVLRDAAAVAVSHQDTAKVIERVDRQRARLDDALERYITRQAVE